MKNSCLYCYKELKGEIDFHEKCALQFFGTKTAPTIPYSFNEMDELAKQVIERSVSVPGVQAKISMSVSNEVKTKNRLTVVGALGGNFILKPPSKDFKELPANEHLTMRIAEIFGIKVVPSSLMKLQSGELAYITKRIDRTDSGEKIHMIDFFQITEAFDKYKSSMEKIGKTIQQYSNNNLLDKLFFFEITLFSFMTGNNDMHLKNFSMIESKSGWKLSPAYDLLNVAIINPEDKEELALTLSGKKSKFSRNHFISFGADLGLTEKQIQSALNRFMKNYQKAVSLLNSSFLSVEMKQNYLNLLEERFSRLIN